MVFRPISLVILLAFAALIVIFSLTPCWYVMLKHIEQRVNSDSEIIFSEFKSEIRHSSILLHPMNSSATNLARFLSSTVDMTNVSFYHLKTQVAPVLFQAFEMVPYLGEISYIGMDGLFFSYYTDHDQVLAMYSNSSVCSFRASNETVYYIQPANRNTGKLCGKAIRTSKVFINGSWFRKTVNSSNGFASLGSKWSNGYDLLFRSSARVSAKVVISLGFSVKKIIDFIAHFGRQDARLYLGTKDGIVLLEGIQNVHMHIFSDDMVSFESENPNANGNPFYEGTILCKDEAASSVFNIGNTKYLFDCSPINIMGVELVYVLAVPQNGLASFIHKSRRHGSQLLSATMVMIIIFIICFAFIIIRSWRRETHLCASLIKQIEATQQAERKSMNKSLAYASASHDVRASLAGLAGLIEMSFEEVVAGSELEKNLKQMNSCTRDLLGLLNSILDTSKIEAGKMQLDEQDFDVSQLLEDVVDLYHPVAIKKGVDIVLDSYYNSILRFSQVKGDRGKLKQVLCNLLSNAVKFTDEGHIIVRAWAQKPSFQNSVIAASKRANFIKYLSDLFHKKSEAKKQEALNMSQKDENCMEFVFEVVDTGKGIPKEKRKSVFENYVQVKETALGLGGTGLGLGIVQSLVRLMHGDIEIVDKDNDEEGTCFKFNVLLTAYNDKWEDNDLGSDRNQYVGRNIYTPTSSSSGMCSPSPKLTILTSSPKPEASRVVLLIQYKARRKTSQKFMEGLGIKVKIAKQWEDLFHILRKIKQNGYRHSQSASDMSSSSISQNSMSRSRDIPLSVMDGTDELPPLFKKAQTGAIPGFVLLIIDANAGPISELCRIVLDFRRGLPNPCKVVWLDKPLNRCLNFNELDEDMFDPNDLVMYKPFHGTRLFEVIKLLPEFGGTWQKYTSSRTKGGTSTTNKVGKNNRDSGKLKKQSPEWQRTEKEVFWKEMHSETPIHGSSSSKKGEIQECIDFWSEKPLIGKRVLIVEDDRVLRKVASAHWIRLGATFELCENGEEAVKLVEEALTHAFPNLPYDYILMDCQMPVMNGFEATKRIREMEKSHGVHIPIIALTAHALESKEASMIVEAGMDVHLSKPIEKERLLEAIKYIHSKE